MKTAAKIICISLAIATPAYAATNQAESFGLLTWLFLGFGALIVMLQLIPGIVIVAAIIKGLLAPNLNSVKILPLQ
jgi:hypothetical protein